MENERIYTWRGYTRHDFTVNGNEAILVEPENTAPGKPWVWRTEFFWAFPSADIAMLAAGYHVAYYKISDMYGCPQSLVYMNEFQDYVVSAYGLAQRTALFGFSRGGLYAFNYAAAHPERVSAVYLDAPVLDLRSWPGGKGKGVGSPSEWLDCLRIYGLDEETVQNFKGMPIDKAESVVKAGIPVIIVAGDSDEVVPFDENGAVLIERFKQLGGEIKLILKPGIGHHPHSLEDPREIVEFIVKNAL